MIHLEDPHSLRNCAVCGRAFRSDNYSEFTCNAESCRVHGRVDIYVPTGLFPRLEQWKIIQHPTISSAKPFPITRVKKIRISENAPIIVITNEYDSSNGDVYSGVWEPQDRAFVIVEFRIEG